MLVGGNFFLLEINQSTQTIDRIADVETFSLSKGKIYTDVASTRMNTARCLLL
jgi:hypothetical protein